MEKILEEIVVKRLNLFLNKNIIINPSQYGFQSEKSANKLLGDFSSYLNASLSKSHHSFLLFIDFSKAFDTIAHKKLLDKLENI